MSQQAIKMTDDERKCVKYLTSLTDPKTRDVVAQMLDKVEDRDGAEVVFAKYIMCHTDSRIMNENGISMYECYLRTIHGIRGLLKVEGMRELVPGLSEE